MGLLTVIALGIIYFFQCFRILNEYERGVVFRLGKVLSKPKGPGLVMIFFPLDRMVKMSLRTIVLDVPPQDVITNDNVSVKVNAVCNFRVVDPMKAIIEIQDFLFATSQKAQTTLRSVLGQVELDTLLSDRERINNDLQQILDEATDIWGIKVASVEVKHVDLPHEMQRAMAKQAEAERERRAKVISAEGEYQASHKLIEAAELMEKHPMALQMRYLQTLSEIATENNSTTLFPVPIDLFDAFKSK